MDSVSPRRYVPAPPPVHVDSQRRLQLRLELAKPSEFKKESESSIVDLLRKTRVAPEGEGAPAASTEGDPRVEAQAEAIETSLRNFQRELVEKERALREKELRLGEVESALTRRASELADARRLLEKRREVLESGLRAGGAEGESRPVDPESLKAMQELQSRLDEEAKSIEEAKESLREREAFLDESENTLFEKMQKHQEHETELDQKADNLRQLEARLNALVEKLRARGEEI